MINIVKISGEDSHKFLQGLVSNDVGKLKESSDAIHTYLLTPQGKFLFEFLITKKEDDFFIVIKSKYFDIFLKKLKMYKLRSKVEIEDLSGELEIRKVKLEESSNNELQTSNFKLTFKDPRFEDVIYYCHSVSIADAAHNLSEVEYKKIRIENLIPEGDTDMEFEASFPMQFKMVETDSVCFKKGCYVGQEVTARTHHRGKIRKTLFQVRAEENIENLQGKEIFADGKKVGKLLSAVDNIALAQLEIEVVENKKPLSCSGIALFRF